MTYIIDSPATQATATPSATSEHRAPPQGGIFDHTNPSNHDPKNPITLFIIQAALIIIFCRLLHYPLSKDPTAPRDIRSYWGNPPGPFCDGQDTELPAKQSSPMSLSRTSTLWRIWG
ncbi:hypothetical protein VTO42DRAFT_5634 [Malbranchea cinnamomea]